MWKILLIVFIVFILCLMAVLCVVVILEFIYQRRFKKELVDRIKARGPIKMDYEDEDFNIGDHR